MRYFLYTLSFLSLVLATGMPPHVAALTSIVPCVKYHGANVHVRLISSLSHSGQMAVTHSDTRLCLLAPSELLRRRHGGWLLVQRL